MKEQFEVPSFAFVRVSIECNSGISGKSPIIPGGATKQCPKNGPPVIYCTFMRYGGGKGPHEDN